MAVAWNSKLDEWVSHGLLDAEVAQRIRAYEEVAGAGGGLRWPMSVALAFGGLLLAAGVLLFVSAHWENISPSFRFTIVVSMVMVFHFGGALVSEKFHGLSLTLHTIGTLACGAGIQLSGQIFNLDEHWPSGVMLWALAAAVGWAILRHWTQGAIFAVLAPFWVLGEWEVASNHFRDAGEMVSAAGVLALALTYFSARTQKSDDPLRVALCWIGGLFLLPLAGIIPRIGWNEHGEVVPAWLVASLVPLAVAWLLRREAAIYNVAAGAWVLLLAFTTHHYDNLWTILVWALGAVGMTAWGVFEARVERINMGILAFLLTVITYYFSNVFDKLGRSFSLIGLGIVFLAGGWAMERLRRGLIARIAKEAK